MPRLEAAGAQDLFAPAGTPREIVGKLNAEVAEITKQRDMQERWTQTPLSLRDNKTEQFAAWLADQLTQWGKLIPEADIKTG